MDKDTMRRGEAISPIGGAQGRLALVERYARELFEAERGRKAIPPFTDRDAAFGVEEAYSVQLENVRRVLAMGQGHAVSGKKIGLTSPGIQRQLGVSEPDYGHLFAAMECAGGVIDASSLIQPKIEAELAFVLKADLFGGAVTEADVVDATDYVVGAFEIVDSRIAGWRIKLPDTVADNASSGRYVLGRVRAAPSDLDLAAVGMKLYKAVDVDGGTSYGASTGTCGGESGAHSRADGATKWALVGEGAGEAVLGDPRRAVAWLANKLWGYGVALKAGEVVLSGAFSAAPAAARGDSFAAEFTGFGRVEARFA